MGEYGRALNPRVPSCRHVSYYGLLVSTVRVVSIGPILVIALVIVVIVRVIHRYWVVTRGVGSIGSRVRRRGIGWSTMYTCSLVLIGIRGSTQSRDAFRVHCLATSIYQWISRVAVGVVGGRVGALVASRVAATVRVGHATGKGGRSLAVRACGCVAPSTVATLVLGHF